MIYSATKKDILPIIDSTLLKPDVTAAEIDKLCADAELYGFACVMVNPVHVKTCKKLLKKSEKNVKVGTVVGFPLGEAFTAVKVAEVKSALKAGADEIDAVVCISAVKAADWNYVKKDMSKVVRASRGRPVKFILETCLLTEAEITKLCELAVEAGARYVKTSTGYASGGATPRIVRLMKTSAETAVRLRGSVMNPCDVKASGGVKTLTDAKLMVEAGAGRIGTSRAAEIAREDDSAEEANEAEVIALKQDEFENREAAARAAKEAEEAARDAEKVKRAAAELAKINAAAAETRAADEAEKAAEEAAREAVEDNEPEGGDAGDAGDAESLDEEADDGSADGADGENE